MRNPTKRCYVCKKLGHLSKNCMNREKVDTSFEKGKEKVLDIKTQMNQQWIKRTPKNLDQANEESNIT